MPGDASRRWSGTMPEAYERWLVPPVFRPFAVDLAARVAERAPVRILELAAGTGVLTAELGAADVVATDFNLAMVALGRRRAPGAAWGQADAAALPFAGGRFDLVACQFGVMFLPDRVAAYAEARRVLAPGGTLLLTTWGTLASHGFQAAVVDALEQLYPGDAPTFLATVPHACADPAPVVADLAAAGFRCRAATVTLEGTAPSAGGVAAGFCRGTPLRAELEARGDLDAATAAVAAEVERRLGSGPVRVRMTANVFEATPDR
ncbi:MAG TPA: class I SAM-dependent methyltransferase [Acidimicrobiales bacterium]|nr:class I SAM-dependent methyltransferase [Acidimicrobiales bacterium]